MKGERVLITGGAGFIGSHLADRLLAAGYRVRVLDALTPQVHPDGVPDYLDPEIELQVGDVRDNDAVRRGLAGTDVVVHFAAAVGVGQSMYELTHYCATNVVGTAALLEVMVKERLRPRRMVVASSMSLYGEGMYECPQCGPVRSGLRPNSQLVKRDWAMRCPSCAAAMEPRPTPESTAPAPTSVYAINKRDQEEMVLTIGRSIGIEAVALRFFNVYGSRQALSNPYTGVAAIFSAALLSGRAPLVFEDGHQLRDFIHVADVANACQLAIERDGVANLALNVGTGRPTSLLQLLDLLGRALPGAEGIEPEILGRFREGDIRACYADMTRASEALGFASRIGIEEGARVLANWVASQLADDRSENAFDELKRHGLVR